MAFLCHSPGLGSGGMIWGCELLDVPGHSVHGLRWISAVWLMLETTEGYACSIDHLQM